MKTSLEEWQRRLRGTPHSDLVSHWARRVKMKGSYAEEPNYHIAAAERMRRLAYMALDLRDEERRDLLARGNSILDAVRETHRGNAKLLSRLNTVARESDAYFEKFGTKTARTYMYEQGLIDLVGDRL